MLERLLWAAARSATIAENWLLAMIVIYSLANWMAGDHMRFIFFLIRLPIAIVLLPFAIVGTVLMFIWAIVGGVLKFPGVFFRAALRNDPDDVSFHGRMIAFDANSSSYPLSQWWNFLVGSDGE